MSVSIEKALIHSNFYEIENTPHMLKYARYNNIISQFIIQYISQTKKWEISFPLNNDNFNYKTSFDNYKKLVPYALERISEFKKLN